MKRLPSRPAFTLVELIVVLGILAILLVLIVPRVTGYIHDAKVTAARSNAAAVMDATELYIIDQETEGADVATTLSNGGPLDAYLNRLGEDTYALSLNYDPGAGGYDIRGIYQRGTTTVQIPSLEVAEGGGATP